MIYDIQFSASLWKACVHMYIYIYIFIFFITKSEFSQNHRRWHLWELPAMTSLVVSAKSQWSILPGGEWHAATGWFPRGSKCDVAGQQVTKRGNREGWVNLREEAKTLQWDGNYFCLLRGWDQSFGNHGSGTWPFWRLNSSSRAQDTTTWFCLGKTFLDGHRHHKL